MNGNSVAERIVLLSGAVSAGKSKVAESLIATFSFNKVSTSTHLRQLANEQGLTPTREILQKLGDDLDIATDYFWPVDVARLQISVAGKNRFWLLDAVRKEQQVSHFRASFPNVFHVHITADEGVLRKRYAQRKANGDIRDLDGDYDQLVAHPNEIASRNLIQLADAVFDTSQLESLHIAKSIVSQLRD